MGAFFSRTLGGPAGIRRFVAFAVLLAAWGLGVHDGSWRPAAKSAPGWLGLQAAALALVALATISCSLLLADSWADAIWTRWWDPAETLDGELEWNRLIELVHHRHDPLLHLKGIRLRTVLTGAIPVVLGGTVIAGAAETVARAVLHPTVPEALLRSPSGRTSADALANLSGNLTALLALIAASVSIWFTYSQLRAKVRADNRQEWLGRTRTLMARVISLAAQHAAAEPRRRAALFSKLDPLRLELELRLNPSEKDHRLLMHLLRRLTFLREAGRAERADHEVLVREIKAACDRMAVEQPARFGPNRYELDWKPVLETENEASLVTYCMRLGHVVLKREWERVKATR